MGWPKMACAHSTFKKYVELARMLIEGQSKTVELEVQLDHGEKPEQ